jgi:hypothetical protein
LPAVPPVRYSFNDGTKRENDMRQLMILASASALGITATAAELQRGRLMRAPDHEFPKWAYGPNGASGIFNSEDEIPAGYVDHPSKLDDFVETEGVTTPVVSANGAKSEAEVAGSTTAASQTITDPAKAATVGVGGMGSTPATGDTASKLDRPKRQHRRVDAHGHPFDPACTPARARRPRPVCGA